MNELTKDEIMSIAKSQEKFAKELNGLGSQMQNLNVNIERMMVRFEESTKTHEKNFERISQDVSSINERMRELEHLGQLDIAPRLRELEDKASQQETRSKFLGVIATVALASLCGVIAEFLTR